MASATGEKQVDVANDLARIYYNKDLHQSIAYGLQALTMAKSIPYEKGIMMANRNLGRAYNVIEDYPRALECLFLSSNMAHHAGDRKTIADNAISIAFAYGNLDRLDKQLEYDLEACSIYRSLGDSIGLARSLLGIGMIEAKGERYDSAISIFNNTISIFQVTDQPQNLAMAYNNLAGVYYDGENYDQAEGYYKKACDIFKSGNRMMGVATVMLNLGRIAFKRRDFKSASDRILEARAITEQEGNKGLWLECTLHLGKLNFEYKHYEDAFGYFKACIPVARELKKYKALAEANFYCARMSEEAGDYKKAYHYNQESRLYDDSVKAKEKIVQQNNFRTIVAIEKSKERIDKLEKERAIRQAELRQQLWQQGFLVVVIVSLLVISLIMYRQYKRKKSWADILEKKNEWITGQKKQIEHANLLLELQNLRSKLDPHMIFNVLNGVRSFIRSADPQKAEEYIGRTAKFIRFALENSTCDWVTVEDEIAFTEHYLEIERFRFPDRFEYSIDVDGQWAHLKIPFMVLQPYVENAILHGILPRNSSSIGKIAITVFRERDTLVVTIDDNGVGRSVRSLVDDGRISMGSNLAQGRLKKLSAVQGSEMNVQIEDRAQGGGTRVTIRLALIKEITTRDYPLAEPLYNSQ